MTSQAIGLAEAVGLPFAHRVARPRAPWRWLPGTFTVGVLEHGLAPGGDPLEPPWPELLITCGRRSAALSIAIRRHSGGRTFTVHIQDPRVSPRHFDLVVPMAHDRLRGANVVPVVTALHRVTPERLEAAGRHFRARLLGEASTPGPVVAVLIGGSSRRHRLDPKTSRRLAERLVCMAEQRRARLLVTASRRTGAANSAVFEAVLREAGAFFWAGEGENPYLGMLSLADFILVTEDSVSMVSEACATGKPVYTLQLPGRKSRRLVAFHEELRRRGMTRPFAGVLERWTYTPLDETARIARIVQERMGART